MPEIWQERKLKERPRNEGFKQKTGLTWDTGHPGLLWTAVEELLVIKMCFFSFFHAT